MRKTHEKILRTLLAVLVLTTAMLSSGCIDDEEEISDSAANDNKQTSDSGNAGNSENGGNKYDGEVNGNRASKLTFSGSDGISIARKQREAEKPMGEDGTQTVFVYMCGSDLESENGLASGEDEKLTLGRLSQTLGYSEYYVSRKFSEISGMNLRDYMRYRRLAFALKELRDTDKGILDIALDYGFTSHEAFTRAFKAAYGITPSAYRSHPVPVVLRTVIRPFDCYLLGIGGTGMAQTNSDIKVYFVTIPSHKFLHIRNYESIGYFDFWEKQRHIPGQDCTTICGLLDSIKGKLDDLGGEESDSGSGQVMAFINEPEGRICSWGIPLAEAYGVRLPADYNGEIPKQMQIMDVPEGEYIVFEHGPFDFQTENSAVEAKIEQAMKDFDYEKSGYELDKTQDRVFYFFHDCKRYWKYIRPVKKIG